MLGLREAETRSELGNSIDLLRQHQSKLVLSNSSQPIELPLEVVFSVLGLKE